MKIFKRFMALVLCVAMTFTLFAGLTLTANAAIDASSTWTEVTWAEIVDGDTIIIANTNNKALPSTTTSTNPTKVSVTVSGSAGSLTVTPGSGTLDSIAWTVDVQSGAGSASMIAKLLQYGSTSVYLRLSSTSSNTALRVAATNTYNTFTMGSAGKLLKLSSANRYVGEYVAGSDWRTYNTETAGNYSGQSLKFYRLNSAAPAVTHTVTAQVSPAGAGSVALGASTVAEGGTTTATATAGAAYDFSGWTISGTGASLSSTSANPTTITMGTADVTVTANFVAKQAYTLTYSVNGDTNVIPAVQNYSGTQITLPTASDIAAHTFLGWLPSTYATSDAAPSGLLAAGESYTMPAANTTLYAVYAIQQGSGGVQYTLVGPDDVTEGTYLIGALRSTLVTDNFYFATAALSGGDLTTNTTPTSIPETDGVRSISSLPSGAVEYSFVGDNTAGFTIAPVGTTNYLGIGSTSRSLSLASTNSTTKWIAVTKTAGSLLTNGSVLSRTTPTATISENSEQVGAIRGYVNENQYRAIYLFKKTAGVAYSGYTTTVATEATYYTLTYSCSPAAGGSIACDVSSNSLVEENEIVELTATAAEHYTSSGWTVTGIAASDYAAEGNSLLVEMTNDVTVVANFTQEPTYTVTINQVTGGTMQASKTTGIYAGETITLTATANEYYTFDSWQVVSGGANISGNSFTMPAENVVITGTFSAAEQFTVTYYDADNHVCATHTYYEGQTIPAADVPTITAPEGFSFKNWYSTTYNAATAPTYTTPAGTTVDGDLEFHAVYAELGADASDTFKLMITKSGVDYYVGKQGASTSYIVSVPTEAEAAEYGLEAVGNGKYYVYFLDGTTKYYIGGAGTSTSMAYPSTTPSYEWTVTETNGIMTFEIGERQLALHSGVTPTRFSTYVGSTTYVYEFNKIAAEAIEGYTTNPVLTKINVTWMNGAEVFLSERVEYGTTITAPAETPEKAEEEQQYFTFAGWSETEGGTVVSSFPTASQQLGDKTYYAVFNTVSKVLITWNNYDNTTLDTEYYKAGDTPVYTGEEPTKPADSSFYYTFSGWTPTVSTVTDAITYTATFQQHERFELTASLSKATIKVGRSSQVNYTLTDMGVETSEFTPSFTVQSPTVASIDSTGRITANAIGTTDVTITFANALDSNGDPLTATLTLTVIADTSAGGYTLMTQDNAPVDWSGDYIIMGRFDADLAYLNTYQILTPKWTDGDAIVEDGNSGTTAQYNASVVNLTPNGDIAEGTIDRDYEDDINESISMESTGDNDFGNYIVYDRITEIDDSFAFTFELVDDINNYYTIRIKGTNYYLANTNTSSSGNNGMQYTTTADANDTTMLWKLRWATAADGLTATEGYTPDVLLIESVYGLDNNVSRCILFNNMGSTAGSNTATSRFRVYGQDAYHSASTSLAGASNGISYSVYLFGNPNPFKAQIYYSGNQITMAQAGEVSSSNLTAHVTSALYPDIADYPNWTQVGDPVWSIVENSANNYMTIAQDGTITLNNSAVDSYALVQVSYTVHDEINNVDSVVSTTAKMLVTAPTYTYSTIIYEDYSGSDTEVQYTINNQVTELPLAAYVVNDDTSDNSKTGQVVMSGTLSWSAVVNSGNGTVNIGSDGILHLADFTTDGIITVTVSGAIGDGTNATDGTFKVYVNAISYTTTIINAATATTGTYDSATDTITYTGEETNGILGYNVVNAQNYDQDDGVFTLYGGAWTISGQAHGATINSSGYLDFSQMDRTEAHTITVLLSRLTAIENGVVTTNLSDTITIVVGARTVEDVMQANNDTVIVDWALPVTFNVLTNDNYNVAINVTTSQLPTGVVSNGEGSFTYTPSGWQTADQSFTYTLQGTVSGVASSSTATVTLKTADSIYYEDTYSDIFTFTGAWTDVTDGTTVYEQTNSLESADIFEYDSGYDSEFSMYSGGTAKVTTVSQGIKPTVSFSFAGTGFDIISATTNNSGAVKLTVKQGNSVVTDADGQPLSLILDTFRGYSYVEEGYIRYGLVKVTRYKLVDENYIPDEAGNYYFDSDEGWVENYTWYSGTPGDFYEDTNRFASMVDPNGTYIVKQFISNWLPYDKAEDAESDAAENCYYQIPILKVTDLPYGTYTVTVAPIYTSAYDRAGDGSYDFYFDGVRIHNPVSGRAAEYKYISLADAVKESGFGSGTVVTCDHQNHEWSDWTFYSRARHTNSATTNNRGSYVQYCTYCGGIANTAYFHVNATADDTQLGVGGYMGYPATTMLRYTITADACEQAGVQAAIQAKLDEVNVRFTEYWLSNTAAILTCLNNSNIVNANGEGTTYATLQLRDPLTQIIYASAIHSPDITVYEDTSHHHVFGSWAHDENSDPSTHSRTCTDAECQYTETEACVFAGVVTQQPTTQTPGVMTYTCNTCGYSYTESIPVLDSFTATFHVPEGAVAPAAQSGTVTMPAAVAAPAAFNAHEYTFVGWVATTVADTATEPTFYEVGDTLELEANTDFYALYTYQGSGSSNVYSMVTEAPANWEGNYIIVNSAKDHAMSNALYNNNGEIVSSTVVVTDNTVVNPSADLIWTLTANPSDASQYSLYNAAGAVYANITGTNSTNAALTATETFFTLEESATDDVYDIASVDHTARCFAYFTTNATFRTYAKSGNNTGYLFKQSSALNYTTQLSAACAHAETTTTTVAATCTEAGSVTVTCDDCNEIISVTETAALGHYYEVTSVVGNVTTYTCSRCGDQYTETAEYNVSYVMQPGVTYSGNSRSGNAITLPTAVSIPTTTYNAQTYTFIGWATATANDSTTAPTYEQPGATVNITADTVFYPVYSYGSGGGGGSGDYVKVTSSSGLTDGTYLIVYETGNVALNGSLADIDVASNTIGVTISNSTITSTTAVDNAAFTFVASNGSFLGTSGKYIGHTGTKNTLNSATTAYNNTVSIDTNGNAVIDAGSDYVLRFNADSGQTRFRFYKSTGTQKAIQLYKKDSGGGSGTTTYTFTLQAAADNYTVTLTPASVTMVTGTTANITASLLNNGTAVTPDAIEFISGDDNLLLIDENTGYMIAGDTTGSTTVTADVLAPDGEIYSATAQVTIVEQGEVTVNYIGSENGLVYNWGTRDTTATFLTAPAAAYYTGNYSYATLSALSGSSASDTSFYSSALGTAIHNMLVAKQSSTTTYNGTRTLFAYTDCIESDGAHLSAYYSATTVSSTWDSGATWNREHTWPESKSANTNDENDIMMLRPTSASENSARGNQAYGESSSYYDPNGLGQNLRGDVARLMLQHLMRWGNTAKFYGTGGVMESRAVLLDWLAEDPVDTWEMGRNDAVERITGVRNVFVDYPELAFILLGAQVPSNYTTPSASGTVAAATYAASAGSGYVPVTTASTRQVTERATSRRIPAGAFSGAAIIDGLGVTNVYDDYAAYGPNHGVYLAPGQGIVFSLTSDVTNITTQDLQIGAKAVNGTASVLDVASITNSGQTSGIKYMLTDKAIVSATEMYYELDGSQVGWSNGESSVIVIYNSGSGVISVTNLRYSTANGNTLTLNISEEQTQRAIKMLRVVYGTEETLADPNVVIDGVCEHIDENADGYCDLCDVAMPTIDAGDDLTANLKFETIGIGLESYIGVQFVVDHNVAAQFDQVYVSVNKDGEQATNCALIETDNNYDVFELHIAPKEITDEFDVTLYGEKDGVTYIGESKENFSLKSVIAEKMGETVTAIEAGRNVLKNEAKMRLFADLLCYGEASQQQFSYNTEQLATEAIAPEYLAYATQTLPVLSAEAITVTDNGATEITMNKCAIGIDAKLEIQPIFKKAANRDLSTLEVVATVDGEEIVISDSDIEAVSSKLFVVRFSHLSAAQMKQTVSFTVRDSATKAILSPTYTYTVEALAQSMIGRNSVMDNLLYSMINYGISATYYFEKEYKG